MNKWVVTPYLTFYLVEPAIKPRLEMIKEYFHSVWSDYQAGSFVESWIFSGDRELPFLLKVGMTGGITYMSGKAAYWGLYHKFKFEEGNAWVMAILSGLFTYGLMIKELAIEDELFIKYKPSVSEWCGPDEMGLEEEERREEMRKKMREL